MMKLDRKPTRKNFQQYFDCIDDPQGTVTSSPIFLIDIGHLTDPLPSIAINLIEKLLQMDPDDRLTAEQCLEHPYFYRYHDPDDEPVTTPFVDEIDKTKPTIDEWRGKTRRPKTVDPQKTRVYQSLCFRYYPKGD